MPLRFRGGSRFANYHLSFSRVENSEMTKTILWAAGYTLSFDEDDDKFQIIARGPMNEELMRGLARRFDGLYVGCDHGAIGPWISIERFWEETDTTPTFD